MSTTTVPEAPDNPPRDYYWADKPELAVDELVDITIRGAKVTGVDNAAYHLADVDGHDLVLPHDFADVSLTRVAPAQWPPQAGDLWRDQFRQHWLAVEADVDDFAGGVAMLAGGVGGLSEPDYLLQTYGPVELLYRQGFTPPAAVAPAERTPASRPEVTHQSVAGALRELADFVEAHPALPMPEYELRMRYLSPRGQDVAGVRAAARVFGVKAISDPMADGSRATHWQAQRRFGPIALAISCIEHEPKTTEPAPVVEQSGGEGR